MGKIALKGGANLKAMMQNSDVVSHAHMYPSGSMQNSPKPAAPKSPANRGTLPAGLAKSMKKGK